MTTRESHFKVVYFIGMALFVELDELAEIN